MNLRRNSLCVVAALVLHSWAISDVHAQARRPTRVAVTVALVDRLPDSVSILRRKNVEPLDVILLHTSADARQLSSAVYDLLMVRQVGGDTAETPGRMRVRANQRGTRPVLPWAERVMAHLRRAEPRAIRGVGTVRAVQIWLPPQYLRNRPAR
jgi:hypothetical protein